MQFINNLEDCHEASSIAERRRLIQQTKYDVGGRKLSGVTGRPSAAKQAGLEQRRKTLLPEHQLRAHMGTFNDRRFGESNPSLSVEEKLQERYTRERQRGQGRRGMFNLEEDGADLFGFDDEGQQLGGSGGGGLTLTHGGRSVNELKGDDFVAQGFGEDDDEGDEERGRVGRDVVRRAHFGGFEQGDDEEDKPERKRSRQEIMNEVIAKSKEHKVCTVFNQLDQSYTVEVIPCGNADWNSTLVSSNKKRTPRSETSSTPTLPISKPSSLNPHRPNLFSHLPNLPCLEKPHTLHVSHVLLLPPLPPPRELERTKMARTTRWCASSHSTRAPSLKIGQRPKTSSQKRKRTSLKRPRRRDCDA